MALKFQKEWDGFFFSNFGSQHSRGTTILLKNEYDIINVHKSEDSRILLINVKVDDQIIAIRNVYHTHSL